MLISHKNKFIYTKTFKTGGTSIESYFEPCCMPDGAWTLCHERDEYVSETGIIGFRGAKLPEGCRWWNHMPAARIRELIGEATWAAYFKFCVVRNPFDKAVSAYYFFRRNSISGEARDIDRERADFEAWLESPGPPIDRDKYLIDGTFCLDEVVRYEQLAGDLERVCRRLEVPWEPARLPTFKTGYRPPHARVEALYNERSRRLVEAAYAFELDHFRYAFPADPTARG